MQFIKDLRTNVGQYLLTNKLKKSKRQVRACNLSQARNIGIVYNSLSKEDNDIVKNLEKEYKKVGKTIEIIGFCNDRVNNGDQIGDKSHTYINLKDFSLFFQPKTPEINSFIEKKFDILINLYPENEFPVDYIIKSSQAFFKVGSTKANKEFLDLMIEIPPNNNDIKYLSEQINKYLNMLNN